MILEASPVLYKATENRAYFQSVRILVPPTWTDFEADFSTWETFDVSPPKNYNHSVIFRPTFLMKIIISVFILCVLLSSVEIRRLTSSWTRPIPCTKMCPTLNTTANAAKEVKEFTWLRTMWPPYWNSRKSSNTGNQVYSYLIAIELN